ncbi:Caspase-12, partial [Cricetulus griseus]
DNILRAKRKQFIRSVGAGTINGLLDELLEKNVLNQEEMERIKCINATVMDKARDLCDSVTKKGPLASQICITYICKEDCYLAGVLELESGPPAENSMRTDDFQGGYPSSSETKEEQKKEGGTCPGPSGSLKLCSLETAQKIRKENPSEIYPIMDTSTRTRLALIICNTEFEYLPRRDGADVDLREMRSLLQDLGYTVKEKENLTALEMANAVKEFADCPEHKTSDSTFLVFMSHGIQEGICGKSYSDKVADVLKVDTIFRMLNTLKCPSLKDKPKVIIIQACRGENRGVVLVKDSVEDTGKKFLVDADLEDDGIKKAHIEKDFIAFCSSTPGKKTYERDPIYKIKGLAKDMLDGVFDDLVEKNVINGNELLRLGEGASFLLNNAENLVENIFEKTEMASKIFSGHIVNSKKQLSLKFHSDDEDDESQKISTSSSQSETKREKEDEELVQDAGVAHASNPILTAPEGIQRTEAQDTLKLCPCDQFYKMKTEKAKEIYPVMEKEGRTRLALIICNKKFDYLFDREDAEVDILNMEELLQNLGYSVVIKENLTAQEMETELMQFAGRPEHQSSDSTFLVFMSHGILEGICGVRHRNKEPDVLPDDTIFTIFNNSNCRSLRNKPKILIMQACRGKHNGIVWVSTSKGIATADTDEELVLSCKWRSSVAKAHVEKDFIAFKSSTPHNISWKVSKSGSLFISKLIDCFKKYCWCYHLEEIFRKVDVCMSGFSQIA